MSVDAQITQSTKLLINESLPLRNINNENLYLIIYDELNTYELELIDDTSYEEEKGLIEKIYSHIDNSVSFIKIDNIQTNWNDNKNKIDILKNMLKEYNYENIIKKKPKYQQITNFGISDKISENYDSNEEKVINSPEMIESIKSHINILLQYINFMFDINQSNKLKTYSPLLKTQTNNLKIENENITQFLESQSTRLIGSNKKDTNKIIFDNEVEGYDSQRYYQLFNYSNLNPEISSTNNYLTTLSKSDKISIILNKKHGLIIPIYNISKSLQNLLKDNKYDFEIYKDIDIKVKTIKKYSNNDKSMTLLDLSENIIEIKEIKDIICDEYLPIINTIEKYVEPIIYTNDFVEQLKLIDTLINNEQEHMNLNIEMKAVKFYINSTYKINNNTNDKMKSSDLLDELFNNISEIGKKKRSISFRNKISMFLLKLGLKKKRCSDGNYYYGLNRINSVKDNDKNDGVIDAKNIEKKYKDLVKQRELELINL